ncbi:MAG: PucC family protein [Paracoccaceae bacterium]
MIIPRDTFKRLGQRYLPFADAGSDGFPLAQILRLSLFQISVGMATVMLLGTLNRVMIVELGVSAAVVATMVALPVLIAPFRALLGFRSDHHRSAIGWRRAPYMWFGSLWQMGGLAIMPFALLVLSGDAVHQVPFAGELLAALAFLMTGLGLHMTQTAGLALASDLADEETRPRVVALLYVMFLIGMAISAVVIGALLADFSGTRLVQVVQGTAVVTVVLNLIALWRQERVKPQSAAERAAPKPLFRDAWSDLASGGQAGRLLAVVFLGTMAFQMQDVLLEPYGGEILGLSVSATTMLTAIWATGALAGFALAARWLAAGINPYGMAGRGLVAGLAAFAAVILSAPMGSAVLFYVGAALIGFGGGLFAVATLTAAMTMPVGARAGRGLALGAWGAAQATAAGLGIAIGGAIKDIVGTAAETGALGVALNGPATGYAFVYHAELGLLFLTLIALGPLVSTRRSTERTTHGTNNTAESTRIGLADLPT